MSDKDKMISVLNEVVVPVLRSKGFSGSFPHFRRILNDRVDLLMFQFNRYGGSFVVEVARAPVKGLIVNGKRIPPEKLNLYHTLSLNSYRLGSKHEDHWFRYGWPQLKINESLKKIFVDIYKKLANEVVELIETEAEEFWKNE